MCSKRHLPDIEQWSQSIGSNVIPKRARPGLAGPSFTGGGRRPLLVAPPHARPFECYPRVVPGAVRSFLEPFCGHVSPKIDRFFRN